MAIRNLSAMVRFNFSDAPFRRNVEQRENLTLFNYTYRCDATSTPDVIWQVQNLRRVEAKTLPPYDGYGTNIFWPLGKNATGRGFRLPVQGVLPNDTMPVFVRALEIPRFTANASLAPLQPNERLWARLMFQFRPTLQV